MIMKKLLLSLALPIALVSCSDKDEKIDPSTLPAPVVESTNIANGSVIDVFTDSLMVTYDANVVYNPLSPATISEGSITSCYIKDKTTLVVKYNSTIGHAYTISLTDKSVIGRDSKKYAQGFDITFTSSADLNLVEQSLTNANATEPAKKLYGLLLENYGKKQLSGAMGEVAWNTGFCDMIYAASGKYPAIVGFDYIHLASSPANWIDYGDISPVKKIWDAGSVPAISWHWNVPKSEDGSSIGYDASSKQFSAANVLVDGTWENQIAVADVEKLAGYLKLLQNAGIPVLWRPFHEAAGDYSWGNWFWWGNSGVEVTKQLWNWLRNKLTNEYGLNNLIWVWTVQTSDQGNLASIAKMEEAYPGDDVVDIVGVDIYADETMTNQSAQFELLYKLVKGKKLVALSECGNLLDVDSAFADGALWSFFMGWYDMDSNGKLGFNQWNTNGEWAVVLNNPLVLNRGDFSLK